MTKISKILTTGLLGVSLTIGLTGCGKEPIPPKQISIQKMDTINMKYKFKDEFDGTPILKNSIKQKILFNMISASRYKNNRIYYNGNVNPTFGKIVKFQNDTLHIEYVNGDQNCNTACTNKGGELTRVIFNIDYQLKETAKNNFELIATFPIKYDYKPDSNVFGSEFEPLDSLNKLELDAKKMFQALSKPITIKRSIEFKGEVNTKYPAKAIYANFKRMLGEFVNWNSWSKTTNEKLSESKKQNSFILKVKEKSYPLHVEVYPYRDGSKVIYSTTLGYTLDSKGGSTLSAKDITELHKKMEAIINN